MAELTGCKPVIVNHIEVYKAVNTYQYNRWTSNHEWNDYSLTSYNPDMTKKNGNDQKQISCKLDMILLNRLTMSDRNVTCKLDMVDWAILMECSVW